MLSQQLPMSEAIAKDENPSGQWEYFWLSLGEDQRELRQSQRAIFDLWANSLPLTQLSPKRKARAFALGLQFGNLETLWAHWDHYKSLVTSQGPLVASFFQRTLDLLRNGQESGQESKESKESAQENGKSGALSPQITQLLDSSLQGKTLLRLSRNDVTLTSQQVKKALHVELTVSKDLQALDKMKVYSWRLKRRQLRFNGLFSKDVAFKLKLLQKEDKLLASTVWSSVEYGNQAKALIASDCSGLISQLEKVLRQVSQKQELSGVAEQLTEIIAQIKEKVTGLNQGSEETKPEESKNG